MTTPKHLLASSLGVLIATGTVYAAKGGHSQSEAPLGCKSLEPALEKVYGLGGQSLQYFISVNGDYVYTITNDGNQILDATTGKMVRIPGSVDPVPTPDGKFMTLPGLDFYSTKPIKDGIARGETDFSNLPIVNDQDAGVGLYQSLGILPGTKTYRGATDSDGSSFAEYQPSDNGTKIKLVKKTELLCPNLALKPDGSVDQSYREQRMQLPMISKDGMHIAMYDTTTQTTKIWSLKDPKKCELEIDLGMPAGKVDFDFSGDRIAFHTDFYSFTYGYISEVSNNVTRDLMVMNLKKGADGKYKSIESFSRLTQSHQKGSGAYYPRWNQKGEIFATRHLKGGQYTVGKYDANKAEKIPYWSPKTQAGASFDKEQAKRYALGSLIAEKCMENPAALSLFDKSLFALSLDPTECKQLVDKYWVQENLGKEIKDNMDRLPVDDGAKKEIAQLSSEDLKDLCGRAAKPAAPVTYVGDHRLTSARTAVEHYNANCNECHTGAFSDNTGNHAPQFKLDSMTEGEIYRSLRLVMSGEMPPRGSAPLTPEAKQELIRMLRDKLNNYGEQE